MFDQQEMINVVNLDLAEDEADKEEEDYIDLNIEDSLSPIKGNSSMQHLLLNVESIKEEIEAENKSDSDPDMSFEL